MSNKLNHIPEVPEFVQELHDGIYPSEVSEKRPIGLTKVDCGGQTPHDISHSADERFNRELRDQPLRGTRG